MEDPNWLTLDGIHRSGFLFLALYPVRSFVLLSAPPALLPPLSHTTLSHTSFTQHCLTHHLSHAIFHRHELCDTARTFYTKQLCHTQCNFCHTHTFATHHLSYTIQLFNNTLSQTHNLSNATLPHTVFHTQLWSRTTFHTTPCHAPSVTHNFVTHHLSHIIVSRTIFCTPSFFHRCELCDTACMFYTEQLCHTQCNFCHTHTHLCYTASFKHNFSTPLCHTQSFLSNTTLPHTQSFTHNFVTHTHNLSHTTSSLTHISSRTTLKIIDPPTSLLSFLLSPCCFNHFFWLLEEVDLWGWPVRDFFSADNATLRFGWGLSPRHRPIWLSSSAVFGEGMWDAHKTNLDKWSLGPNFTLV